jgi:HEPN domain-containing protein
MANRTQPEASSEAWERFFDEYLDRADSLLDDAEDRFRRRRYPDVVTAVEQALELIVKGLFHWAEVTPPRSHRVGSPEFARQLRDLATKVRDLAGPVAWQELQLSRLIFLADFWGAAHTLARYGSEATEATPSQLFKRPEARLALVHLKEAIARLQRTGEAVGQELLAEIARQEAGE